MHFGAANFNYVSIKYSAEIPEVSGSEMHLFAMVSRAKVAPHLRGSTYLSPLADEMTSINDGLHITPPHRPLSPGTPSTENFPKKFLIELPYTGAKRLGHVPQKF